MLKICLTTNGQSGIALFPLSGINQEERLLMLSIKLSMLFKERLEDMMTVKYLVQTIFFVERQLKILKEFKKYNCGYPCGSITPEN